MNRYLIPKYLANSIYEIDFIRLLTGSLNTDANGIELKKEF